MSKFNKYRRKKFAELRPVEDDESLMDLQQKGISVSDADIENGSPMVGDMIARNPKDHNDQWLVSKEYFEDNFEPITQDQ